MSRAFRLDELGDSLATLTFDDPDRKANVFNRSVLTELVDEDVPIAERIDSIEDVPGLTSDLYTAIMLVAISAAHAQLAPTETAVNEDVGLLAFSPLGAGFLTGKYQGGTVPDASRITPPVLLPGMPNPIRLDLAVRGGFDGTAQNFCGVGGGIQGERKQRAEIRLPEKGPEQAFFDQVELAESVVYQKHLHE